MKYTTLLCIIFSISFSCFADDSTTGDKMTFPLTQWSSKNSSDPITIQNGAGLPLVILINVSKTSNGGVSIQNCGTVSNILPGSSAVCTTSDASNPVTITSSSPSLSAEGDYQIKQQ